MTQYFVIKSRGSVKYSLDIYTYDSHVVFGAPRVAHLRVLKTRDFVTIKNFGIYTLTPSLFEGLQKHKTTYNELVKELKVAHDICSKELGILLSGSYFQPTATGSNA